MSLEPPDVRAAAANVPRGFLEQYSAPVIFDEVLQYAPDLLPFIKENIDANRATSGQYLLTGSQNPNIRWNAAWSISPPPIHCI